MAWYLTSLTYLTAFDVDFCCGHVAVYASRNFSASVAIYELKSLRFLDEMEIDHLSNAATSIIKLTEDWIIRQVETVTDTGTYKADRRLPQHWIIRRIETEADTHTETETDDRDRPPQ